MVTKLCAASLSADAKPQLSDGVFAAGAPASVSDTEIVLKATLWSMYWIWPLSCSIWPVICPSWFCTAMMSDTVCAFASSASIALRCASSLARRA